MNQPADIPGTPPGKDIETRVKERLFPFLGWIRGYRREDLRPDLMAGLTVALILVPQSMAYAQLAGVPAYFGLYAALLPPMIAVLFGSSRHLATGPMALLSLLSAAALEPLATAGSTQFIAYSILMAFIVGCLQLILGILRLGMVINFLSHPVIKGFTNAGVIIIATSQFPKLLGVYVDKSEYQYETVYYTVKAALSYTHLPTVLLAALALAIMILLRRYNPRLPNVLIAVVITTIISWAIGFEDNYKAHVSDLLSPAVNKKIADFNETVAVLTRLQQRRVELGERLNTARERHGAQSSEAIIIDAEINVVNLSIDSLHEKEQSIRNELREYKFIDQERQSGQRLFYSEMMFPSYLPDNGRRWRLQVDNQQLGLDDTLSFVGGGAVVGNIPSGLPMIQIPGTRLGGLEVNKIISIFPMAIIIALIGFIESITIAKVIASRSKQILDPNQELIGQGLANIASSFTQGHVVGGSFARSAVNYDMHARTGLSNIIASAIVLIVLLFFTPLLYHLPLSVLAAIIIMAVFSLIDVKFLVRAWRTHWYDGLIGLITFVVTLIYAPKLDRGLIIGAVLSLAFYLYHGMRPYVALLSKHRDGTYRDCERFHLRQCPHIALLRLYGSVFFASVDFLERRINEIIETMPELKLVIIVSPGINELDSSGVDMLSDLVDRVRSAGKEIVFANVREPILDVMKRGSLYRKIGPGHIYPTAQDAVEHFWHEVHRSSREQMCPLQIAPIKKLPVADSMKKDLEIMHDDNGLNESLPEE